MRSIPLILSILFIVLVVFLWKPIGNAKKPIEGYESLEDKIQDRANPLAQNQNPLTNPAVPIGISEQAGATLRSMAETALNIPNQIISSTGSITQTAPINTISPRIDNENSFLGLVKFCKDKGAGENPFADPSFNENCGMCITSGKLITGETFTKPTGVVVYKKDKDIAFSKQRQNGQIFPRAFPSLNAATCVGASMSDDAQPVLALTGKDYQAFQKRQQCRANHTYGQECSQCILNKEFTYVPADGGTQPVNLWLWGQGVATVRVGGSVIGKEQTLDETTPVTFQLGAAKEGSHIQIEVIRGTGVIGPYVYGALQSTNPNNKPYRLQLELFIEKDSTTGSFPRRSIAKSFQEVQLSLAKILPKPDGDRMVLEGTLPLTFIESDQLAAYDCPASPFVSTQEHAELLVSDPCLNPRGQGPNNYNDECLRQTVLEGGCSADGTLYKNDLPPNVQAMTLGGILNWVRGIKANEQTDPAASMSCRGVDISTPCDPYLTNGSVPDKKCLRYLYRNESEANKRVGRAYKDAPSSYTSLNNGLLQFCQMDGALNPDTPEGEAELIKAANGYKGYKGIDAVKTYLSDVFMKATGNLDMNLPDDQGGRKTSWMKCFGMKLADPVIETVKKNSFGDVMDKAPVENWNTAIPSAPMIINGQVIARNIWNSGNYVLQFSITPKGLRNNWGSILHFTRDGQNCCGVGQRMPAIWFYPNALNLHIRIGDSWDGNWGIDTHPLPMNQKSTIRIECDGKNVIITVNDRVYTGTQPSVRPSGNAIVYCADPWYEPANAVLEDLKYRTW